MGEKVEQEKKAVEAGDKKKAEGGEKKENAPIDVVLKLDLHCEGCAKKVRRAVRKFEGVGDVKADFSANKLIVTGNVDPGLLRENVESKTKKKVDLISPQPKKDAGGEKPKADQKSEKKADEKKPEKPKEPATVVLKIKLHCQGCAHKIKRTVRKNVDGVATVTSDLEKDLVTVTGTMDVGALTAFLQDKIKRSVVVVPPQKKEGSGEKKEEKKDGEKGGEKKAEKKEGGGGGGGEKKEGKKEGEKGGEKKEEGKKEGGGGEKKEGKKEGGGGGGDGAPKAELNKMEFSGYNPYMQYAIPMFPTSAYAVQYAPPPPPPTYVHPADQGYFNPNQQYHPVYFNHGYPVHGPPVPPPPYMTSSLDDRMFSDENPQGCSVM